ncbi:MAG: DEAD/DEAH box helicase [bacterium]
MPGFTDLGLPRRLTDALFTAGIRTPFPIQAAVIGDVLAGRDVLGRAATGSGKTLAFGLPLLARLEGSRATARRPRGLVLVPTRELAMQVTDALTPLARACGLTVRLVAGGLPIGSQISALASGVDVLVCTPGRLEDLLERRACDLGAVEVSVLDEADHMADLGFLPAVRRILNRTPAGGQRLLFSATLDGDVATLVAAYLQDPAAHAVASATAQVDTMSHHLFTVSSGDKVDLAARIGSREGRTLMFVRTKHGADRLARQLGKVGVAAGALHGGRSQPQRTRALSAFREGSVPVLVATDVAARGIHIDDVSLVLHVDPPADHKDYLHRSGRTARAGASGTVVVLATPEQERPVRQLLTQGGVRAEQHRLRFDDPEVGRLTGARAPSGVPVSERSGSTEATSSRTAGTGRASASGRASSSSRPSSPGRPALTHSSARPASAHSSGRPAARHPQAAERRPRRSARRAGGPVGPAEYR